MDKAAIEEEEDQQSVSSTNSFAAHKLQNMPAVSGQLTGNSLQENSECSSTLQHPVTELSLGRSWPQQQPIPYHHRNKSGSTQALSFGSLMPIILPKLSPDRAENLGALYDKMMRSELSKDDFLSATIPLVGSQMLVDTFKLVQKQKLQQSETLPQNRQGQRQQQHVQQPQQQFPPSPQQLQRQEQHQLSLSQILSQKQQKHDHGKPVTRSVSTGDVPSTENLQNMPAVSGQMIGNSIQDCRNTLPQPVTKAQQQPASAAQKPPCQHTTSGDTQAISLGTLMPLLLPKLSADQAERVHALYRKRKRTEISKDDFLRVIRLLVGDQVFVRAVKEMQQQQKQPQQLPQQTLEQQPPQPSSQQLQLGKQQEQRWSQALPQQQQNMHNLHDNNQFTADQEKLMRALYQKLKRTKISKEDFSRATRLLVPLPQQALELQQQEPSQPLPHQPLEQQQQQPSQPLPHQQSLQKEQEQQQSHLLSQQQQNMHQPHHHHHLSPEMVEIIYALYEKVKKTEVSNEDFLGATRVVVGDQVFENAMKHMQPQQQQSEPLPQQPQEQQQEQLFQPLPQPLQIQQHQQLSQPLPQQTPPQPSRQQQQNMHQLHHHHKQSRQQFIQVRPRSQQLAQGRDAGHVTDTLPNIHNPLNTQSITSTAFPSSPDIVLDDGNNTSLSGTTPTSQDGTSLNNEEQSRRTTENQAREQDVEQKNEYERLNKIAKSALENGMQLNETDCVLKKEFTQNIQDELIALREGLQSINTKLKAHHISSYIRHPDEIHIVDDEVIYSSMCRICNKKLKKWSGWYTLGCQHMFHFKCLITRMRDSSKCITCGWVIPRGMYEMFHMEEDLPKG